MEVTLRLLESAEKDSAGSERYSAGKGLTAITITK